MGSIVKSIGKAIGKLAKGIGKLVKKALPIILMAGVAYMGIAAYGAMGSGLTGAAAASGATNFTAGSAKIISGGGSAWESIKGFFGFGSQSMAGAAGGTAGGSLTPFVQGSKMFSPGESTAIANAGLGIFSGNNSAYSSTLNGMSGNDAIANAMKYQSDMMWKGTLLKAGGAFLGSMFDESDEIAKRQLDITEDEFKRRHTYGGFAMDSGKPSDYAKPGQPGHDPTGFRGQMGGPPQFGYPSSNKGGPRQFQQAGLKTPRVNAPGLINSRQGQRQTAGLLGQRNKSVV